jgi:AcrR family transcriptional regulator
MTERLLRADARRNHEQLLAAARDVIVERGPQAPLDEIARRAGVGIGTLYRRFPDRGELLRAVVIDALQRTETVARTAADEEGTAFAALVRYLHEAIDLRVAAVIPAVLDLVAMDEPDLAGIRGRAARALQRIIDEAHAEGSLPTEITFGDVGTLVVRLSRPLPGVPDDAVQHALAHRHVDLLIAGLRQHPARVAPVGSGLTRAQLRRLRS